MKLTELLFERFFNAFTISDKERFADEIWNMLQKSYASIGGIKGSGFGSKEEMIQKIPMIKVGLRNGIPVMALFYKDKSGRKRVAIATNGTAEGKELLKMALVEEIKTNRAFGELSGPSWGFLQKIMDSSELINNLIPAKKVQKILPQTKIILGAGNDIRVNPKYKDFYYQRNIGGTLHTKIMIGTPNISIQ